MTARIALLLVALVVTACAATTDSRSIDVSNARIGEPAGVHAAAYMTLKSDADDRLVAAATDVAREVQLHVTATEDDGSVRMEPTGAIALPAGQEVVLEPGGTHLMLMDVEPLEAGDTVTLELEFERFGTLPVTATVVELAEVFE